MAKGVRKKQTNFARDTSRGYLKRFVDIGLTPLFTLTLIFYLKKKYFSCCCENKHLRIELEIDAVIYLLDIAIIIVVFLLK